VILTGMGIDGAQGVKEVRDAGGFTIAQDESTSIVYSMPRFAVEMDAACESLPLREIAPRLLAVAMPGAEKRAGRC
jgi:two-component system chemotaxis response regulator CheB